MNNTKNSHVFFRSPLLVLMLTACLMIVFYGVFTFWIKSQSLLVISMIGSFCVGVFSHQRLKINYTGIFVTYCLGLWKRKKILWSDVTNIRYGTKYESDKPVESTATIYVSTRNKDKEFEIVLNNYPNSTKLTNTIKHYFNYSHTHDIKNTKERTYIVLVSLSFLIMLVIAILPTFGQFNYEFIHINKGYLPFGIGVLTYQFMLVAIIWANAFTKKLFTGYFSEKKSAIFISMLFTLPNMIPAIDYKIKTDNEKNLPPIETRNFELTSFETNQYWESTDNSTLNESFKIKSDSEYFNKDLKQGKIYRIPFYKGKYKDYFLPKDAFKKAMLATDSIENK